MWLEWCFIHVCYINLTYSLDEKTDAHSGERNLSEALIAGGLEHTFSGSEFSTLSAILK